MEYRVPWPWRILAVLFAAGVAGVVLAVATHVLRHDAPEILLAALFMLPFAAYGAIYTVRGRLRITDAVVELRRPFGTLSMRREDIIGHAFIDNHTVYPYLRLTSKTGEAWTIDMPFDVDHRYDAWVKTLP